jgi:hypothetical protein
MGTLTTPELAYGLILSKEGEPDFEQYFKDKDGKLVYDEEEGEGLYEYIEDNYPLLELEFAGNQYYGAGTTIIAIKSTIINEYEHITSFDPKSLTFTDEEANQLQDFMSKFGLSQTGRKPEWHLWYYSG